MTPEQQLAWLALAGVFLGFKATCDEDNVIGKFVFAFCASAATAWPLLHMTGYLG